MYAELLCCPPRPDQDASVGARTKLAPPLAQCHRDVVSLSGQFLTLFYYVWIHLIAGIFVCVDCAIVAKDFKCTYLIDSQMDQYLVRFTVFALDLYPAFPGLNPAPGSS